MGGGGYLLRVVQGGQKHALCVHRETVELLTGILHTLAEDDLCTFEQRFAQAFHVGT